MAKISAYTENTSPANDSVIVIVDSADSITKKVKISNLLNNVVKTGSGTIEASAGTTVITNASVTADSIIIISPTSSGASEDIGSTTGVYVSAKTAGVSFELTHPNNATANKTFDYLIFN